MNGEAGIYRFTALEVIPVPVTGIIIIGRKINLHQVYG
jgi:hypothetical protein